MSGAEAAGLAVGVIALASLFNTCVELLEYFELGKNLANERRSDVAMNTPVQRD